jgi:hypothetical protein
MDELKSPRKGRKPFPLCAVLHCNISGLEATKREETDMCIAFMHRNPGNFRIKHVTVTEISLDLMELK